MRPTTPTTGVDPAEWLGKEDGPAAALENEDEQGITIAYEDLIKRWTENQ
jgi:glycerol transport system substrate-binding protein